jgi:hypothetical protein
MSLNYSQLVSALEDYLQYNDSVFVDNIPVIVQQAEDRIYQSIQAPVERKNSIGALTAGNQYLGAPADMLSVASFAVVSGSTYTFMLPREVSFIREAYPSTALSGQGLPKCYALFDQTTFIFGPTPDVSYSLELNYHAKPESIVTAGTSWIGDNFESILLSGCLLEAYIFLKGDSDLIQLYDNRYKEALTTFQLLGEGLDERDSFRNGTKRTQVKS